jgi:hypothetical protein
VSPWTTWTLPENVAVLSLSRISSVIASMWEAAKGNKNGVKNSGPSNRGATVSKERDRSNAKRSGQGA